MLRTLAILSAILATTLRAGAQTGAQYVPDATTTTKGKASFNSSDFNVAGGAVTLDYANAQAASGSLKGFLSSTDWTTFNAKQGGDATLTGLASLTTGAGKIPYATGTDTFSTFDSTAFGRSTLNVADAAASRALFEASRARFDVTNYGAKGDSRKVADASITGGSSTVTSATANFTAADVGKIVYGVETATGLLRLPRGTITAVNSSTSITVSTTASSNYSNVYLVFGTDDTTAIRNAVTAAQAANPPGLVFAPAGGYLFNKCLITLANSVTGDGIAFEGEGSGRTILFPDPTYDFTTTSSNGGMFMNRTGAGSTVRLRLAGFTIDGSSLAFTGNTGYHVVQFGAAHSQMHDVRIINFKGNQSYGLYVTSSANRFTLLHVENGGWNGIGVVAGSNIFVNCYSGNNVNGYSFYTYNFSDSTLLSPPVVWSGGVIDESTLGGAYLQASDSVRFCNGATLYGPGNQYALTVDGTSTAYLDNCVCEAYSTSGNRGGAKVLSGGTLYASATKFAKAGTLYSIDNAGTVYDGGLNTLGAVNGTQPVYGGSTTVPVAKGGTGLTALGTGVVTAIGNATNATGGVVTVDGAATLTNKTLTSPIISGGTIDNAVIGGTTKAAGGFTTVTAVPAANSNALAVTGYSLTSANAQSLLDLAGTWNTSGNPTALLLNITNTASGSTSNLMDLQVGGTSKFKVDKSGVILLRGVTETGSSEIKTATDALNGSVDALWIVPPATSRRIFFGRSGQAVYALNFSNVSQIESMPTFTGADGLQICGQNSNAIYRGGPTVFSEGVNMTFNATSGGETRINWLLSSASFHNPLATDVRMSLGDDRKLWVFGAYTSSTNYEALLVNAGTSGKITLEAAKGTSGSYRDLILRSGGVDTLKSTTAGELTALVGLNYPVANKTSTFTATAAEHTFFCDATSAPITANLPAAASYAGRVYIIVKTDSSGNAVTIDPAASETLNGSLTQAISAQYGVWQIQSNGTNWFKIN